MTKNVFRKGDTVIVQTRAGAQEGTVQKMMDKQPFDLQIQVGRTLHYYPQTAVRHKKGRGQ